MLIFDTAAAVAAAPTNASVDPALGPLLEERVRGWAEAGLLGLTHLLVVEPQDSDTTFSATAGWSLLLNPLDSRRLDEDDYTAPFDIVTLHAGWVELTMCVGNDGFAYSIFLPTNVEDAELQALARLLIRVAGE